MVPYGRDSGVRDIAPRGVVSISNFKYRRSLVGGSFTLRPNENSAFHVFLEKFPCFLPCLIVAAINLTGLLISFFGLKEVRSLISFLM